MNLRGWIRCGLVVALGLGSVQGGGARGQSSQGYQLPTIASKVSIVWQPLTLADQSSSADNLKDAIVRTFGEYRTYNLSERYGYVAYKDKYYSSYGPDCQVLPVDGKNGIFFDYCSAYSGDVGYLLDLPMHKKFFSRTKLIGEFGNVIYLLSMDNQNRVDSWLKYPIIYAIDLKHQVFVQYKYFQPPKEFGEEDFCRSGYSYFSVKDQKKVILFAGQCRIKLSIELRSMAGKYFYDKR